MGQVEVADQVRGVEFLRTLPYVDARLVGIFGWSYGGYLTLMCLLNAPDYFQAGVSGAPVTDWQLYDTHYTERYLGLPTANAAGYAASAVMPYAGNLRAPLLVMHGMADDNVLFTHSTRLFGALQKLNKPFDVMTYPGTQIPDCTATRRSRVSSPSISAASSDLLLPGRGLPKPRPSALVAGLERSGGRPRADLRSSGRRDGPT
jgi:dienelactone hydrolase